MKKEDLLKVLGFKSCYICGVVYTKGKSLRCLDHDRDRRDGSLKETVYDFCTVHEPTFNCNIAIGNFGKFYKDALKCFRWISGSTETAPYWIEIELKRVREWLDKIYE